MPDALNTPANYTAVNDAAQSVSDDATAAMQNFSTAQSARSTRLTAVRVRLQKNPKTPPATLAKLNTAIAAASAAAQYIGSLAGRIASRPNVDSADLAVFGRVLDSTGAPAPDLYLRLSDSAGSLKVGSRVKTDASGDFSLVLKSCELPAKAEGVLVAVEDVGGTRLTASGPVTPKAGSPVYVDLSLPAKQPAKTQPRSKKA